jgi:hypothetical protein
VVTSPEGNPDWAAICARKIMDRIVSAETDNGAAMTVIVGQQPDRGTGVDGRQGWFGFDSNSDRRTET